MLDAAALARLSARAATLDERLSPAWEPLPGEAEAAERRLEAWCLAAAAGDRALFARRLARDGLSRETALRRLGAIRPAPGAPPPPWLADAAWIAAALTREAEPPCCRPPGPPLPFEGLFGAFAREAERRRDALLPAGAAGLLGPAARADLLRRLLADATALCAGALYQGFAERRRADGARPSETARGLHDGWLAALRAGELGRLFEAKPVLLRLLAVQAQQWIVTTAELLARLCQDYPLLRATLLPGRDPGPLAAVASDLSDPHRGGRRVCRLRFADGRSLIYKPKDLAVDAAWAGLLDALNRRRPPAALRAGQVLPRAGYGWAECIEPGDCADRASAERFFRRAGGLLALAQLLAGSDLHEENLIAAGEAPVPIDLEMLFQAQDGVRRSGAPALRAREAAEARLQESLLSTGLLPSLVQGPDTGFATVGGLSGDARPRPPAVLWRHLGTDAMTAYRGSPGLMAVDNLPRLDGETLRLADYAVPLREGCAAWLRFLLGQKAALLADEGPLAAFAGAPIRRLLRPTAFYWLLQQRLRDHRSLDDGAVWSAQADFVARLADWEREEDPLWPLLAAERRALLRLDIPFFVQAAGGEGLGDGEGEALLRSGFASGLAEARRRIAALDEAEIERQLEVLRLATIRDAFPPGRQAVTAGQGGGRPAVAGPPLDRALALERAGAVARQLAEHALREGEGAAWIGLEAQGEGGWRLAALGEDLYGGASGIALFLAAHARVAGDTDSRDLALAALAGLRHRLGGAGAGHFVRVMPLGGAEGLGSLLYALTVIAGLLDEPRLREEARALALRLGDARIASDRVYDVVGGAAGCILGLLRLYRDCGDRAVLERAVACGRHLLAQRPRGEGGAGEGRPGLWRHLGGRPLTGFSHGAAGFAYALAALAEASGETAFAAAARDCLAYERALFSPERGNWPDLRATEEDGAPSWPCQWCHGAAGIGLARLAMLRFGRAGETLEPEIAAALETARRRPLSPLDTLCCGNLGNAELLAEAARTLDRPALAQEASAVTAALLAAAEARGGFGWNAAGDAENLGLFRGLAGVGYGLLRRVAPDALPNVLIWE